LQRIVTEMPKRASVEWRHFPTHPPDPALHVAALAFEGQHFFGFGFRVLTDVFKAGGMYDKLTPERLAEFAKAEGGSEQTLKEAYEDKAKWAAVKRDLMAGNLMGVKVTPGLFHNGYFLTPGGMPADTAAFDKSLRAMIAA
jgi:protein-disulfide isomerase